MPVNPQSTFWWNDWENDLALKACSLQAQGLWMRMLCIAAKADPYGYVLIEGRTPSLGALANVVGRPEAEVTPLIEELERNGVFSRDTKQRIFSRRLVRDAKRSAEARKHGKKGGNPNLRKTKENSEGVKGGPNPGANPNSSTLSTSQHTHPPDAYASGPPGGQAVVRHGDDLFASDEPKPARAGRKTALAPEWKPTHGDRTHALQQGLDDATITALGEQFRDHHLAKRSTMADWAAAWRTWVRNHISWHGTGPWPRDGGGRSGQNRAGDGGIVAAGRALIDLARRGEPRDSADGLEGRATGLRVVGGRS